MPQPATVVFYPSAWVRIRLQVDGQNVCGKGISSGKFCSVTVPPGPHEFTAAMWGGYQFGPTVYHGGSTVVEAGKTYYFAVCPFAGGSWRAYWTLCPVAEAEATFALQSLKPQN